MTCPFFSKQCFAVFNHQKHRRTKCRRLFQVPRSSCGLSFWKFLNIYLCFLLSALHEKRPLLRSTSTKINYQTIVTVPYAHVLRDDKISIESSYLVEGNPGETYLLFNSVIPDQEYEKGLYYKLFSKYV